MIYILYVYLASALLSRLSTFRLSEEDFKKVEGATNGYVSAKALINIVCLLPVANTAVSIQFLYCEICNIRLIPYYIKATVKKWRVLKRILKLSIAATKNKEYEVAANLLKRYERVKKTI